MIKAIVYLPMADGRRFIIDAEDWPTLYGLSFSGRGDYVGAWNSITKVFSYVHRLLMPDQLVDHINNDPLDNRRINLRYATRSINNQNRPGWGSLPKGISMNEKGTKYRARLQVNGKRLHLGWFDSAEEAVTAYNQAAIEYYGQQAWLSGEV